MLKQPRRTESVHRVEELRNLTDLFEMLSSVSLVFGNASVPVSASTSPSLTARELKVASKSLSGAAPKRCIWLIAVRLRANTNSRLSTSCASIAAFLAFLASPDDHGSCDQETGTEPP